IAILLQEGESADAAPKPTPAPVAASAAAEPTTQGEVKPVAAGSGDHGRPADGGEAPSSPATGTPGDRVKASPLARRIAADKGVDLSAITGSGPNGRIVKADVAGATLGAAAAPVSAPAVEAAPVAAPKPAAIPDIPHQLTKLSNMRKTIARRLTESKQQVPHIYLTVDVRLDALLALRAELNHSLEARGIKLSVNDMLVKALAVALIEVPKCNVMFTPDQLVSFTRADISVAVSTPAGLITPIVQDAASKSLSAIATEIKELAGLARENKLKPEQFQGGTASISNMGMYGIKQFDAVINPPQAMILAVGAGEKRAHVVDDQLAVATVMSATGSFDHRAIDGADGAELMRAFRQLVERPLGMLA
ncbi:MAG TPA: 2-oxo acid dehydrogenase subunit E2, partial [Sphingomonas sp.]